MMDESAPGGATILVVEDDALNRKLLRTLLSIGRYRVMESADAESGIAMARENPPACILVDIRLPGMDGLAATRIIKADARLRHIPVVAVTAMAIGGEERKALDAGCDGYITKPIDTRAFLENVRHFLLRARPAHLVADSLDAAAPRILVVDRDETARRMFSETLAREGYAVIVAADGAGALSRAQAENPDLVLLDVGMPGMESLEVARRLKGNLGTLSIPIILVTALSDTQSRLKGLESGADEFLATPVDSVELLVRIKSMIRLRRFQDQLARRAHTEQPPGALVPEEQTGAGTATPTVVLVAEQDEDAAGRMGAALVDPGCRVIRARSHEQTLAEVSRQKVDILLLGSQLPGMDTFDLCRLLKEEEGTGNIQIIVVSPPGGPACGVSALEHGADDCLAFPLEPLELLVRVRLHAKRKARLDQLLARCQSAMVAAANDSLTGLTNNATFKRLLGMELKRSQRHSQPGAMLFMDIDDFKRANDTLGHVIGDMLLAEVARILKAGVREFDIAARYGGEEFAILLPHTDRTGARVVAERLRSAVAGHSFLAGVRPAPVKVTVSIGIACFPAEATTAEDLIKRADEQTYRAKQQGKDRVCSAETKA